jgi:glycosyltransferase involved in cell wall biosynthesis
MTALHAFPIRVCHLITDLDTGGAERSLVNLLAGIDRGEFKCDVVTLIKPGAMAAPLVAAGIPITSLEMRRSRPNPLALLSLLRYLRATKPAILQTWLYHADFVGTIAARIVRPERLVWNVRCTDITRAEAERPIGWLVRLLAALSRRPDAIVVNSRTGQADHERLGYRPRRWAHISNGVDLVRFQERRNDRFRLRSQLGLEPNKTTVGFVARDHPMKDVNTLLHAASLLLKRRPDTRFVLCGEGLTAQNAGLVGTLMNLNLERHVILLGPRSDMENIYPVFDILALCSIYGEGFPNVLCEAMACGVPCVATDVGDCVEIIGDCGIVVPRRDPEALAQACEALVERGLQEIGVRARRRMVARYGVERMVAQYQSLYRSLMVADC